ncbi:BON domain-containing protein [Gemmatimonas sp.]|uniref:BON domain-containing protein n=1 Tax=Gemmatimonas sp. TaxID=1962908 RepID=UPI0037C15187
MAHVPFRKRPTRTSSVLLVALGAVAGVALGMLVADRLGGVNGLLRRGGRGSRREPGLDGRRDDERRTEPLDEVTDDDAELAGDGARQPLADAAVPPMGPSVPTHEELESRVLEAFRNDPVLEARAIDIGAVGAGTIELTGWVDSTGEIAHALILARGVPGVTAVVDQLAVRGAGALHSHRTAQYETPHRR